MSEVHPSRYEIRVQGHLAPRRLDCFEDVAIAHQPGGETHLLATCSDQAALHGLLNHLYNLGVTLLSVHRLSCPKGRQGQCQWQSVPRGRHANARDGGSVQVRKEP